MALTPLRAIANVPGGIIVGTLGTPLSSETIAPVEDLILHVKTSGTITTITFVDPGFTPSGTASAVLAVTTAATEERMIAVPQTLMAPSTGLITVTFSSLTGVTGGWYLR